SVQAPAPNLKAIETQIESFVAAYNKVVEELQTQLTTKPLENAQKGSELAVGSLFRDPALNNLVSRMRQAMYSSIEGLPKEMSSPLDIGISTGAATATSSRSALSGLLKLNTTTLARAVQENPAGAKAMMQQWAEGFSKVLRGAAGAGGSLEARINGDESQ